MKQLFIPGSASTPSRRLILYFNGWALGPVAVEHLAGEQGYDLLILWDYRDDQLDFDFHPYRELRLVAWSMGVWAADRFFSEHPRLREHLISGTAVAGTGYPMDDVYGIPEAVYQATLGSITEENRAPRTSSTTNFFAPTLSSETALVPCPSHRRKVSGLMPSLATMIGSSRLRAKRLIGGSKACPSLSLSEAPTISSATSATGTSCGSRPAQVLKYKSRDSHIVRVSALWFL